MSIKLMTAVWELPIAGTEKLVLLALADSANDNGKCWPSIPTIAAKSSMSKRAVQMIIKALCDRRLLHRRIVAGKGVVYHVHPAGDAPEETGGANAAPVQAVRPAKSAPVQMTAQRGATVAPKPSRTTNTPRANALGVERVRKRNAETARLLPESWEPKPLDGDTAAIVERWAVGRLERELARFRDHWRAAGGANARKRDWDAAWRNWLRREDNERTSGHRGPSDGQGNRDPALDMLREAQAELEGERGT